MEARTSATQALAGSWCRPLAGGRCSGSGGDVVAGGAVMTAHEDWLDQVFRVTPDDRDRQWVELELGDVPVRIRDWFGETVPVESLGRDE